MFLNGLIKEEILISAVLITLISSEIEQYFNVTHMEKFILGFKMELAICSKECVKYFIKNGCFETLVLHQQTWC